MSRSASYTTPILVLAMLGFLCLLLQATGPAWLPPKSWWHLALGFSSAAIFLILGCLIARCAARSAAGSDESAAHAAHDFNNILQVILGRVSALVDDDPALTAEQREELEVVIEACERGASLTARMTASAAEEGGVGPARASAEGRALSGSAPRTVLVIDDHPAVATLACELLQRLGHAALKATDPAEGLVLFEERADEIDIVMVDWMMPGMTGDDVISAVRETKPQVRVIVSSGHSLDADTRRRLENVGVVLVPKPATLGALAAALGC